MKDFFSNIHKSIKELKKSPRGQGILFFGFYFIFFLVLAIFARIIPGDTSSLTEDKKEDNLFLVSKYNGDNYYYNYTFNVDEYTAEVDGSKYKDVEKFTYTFGNIKKDYIKSGLVYYSDGISVANPNELLNIVENIDYIVQKSSLDAETNYQSGRKLYKYQVSSATINKILTGEDLDVSEEPNEVAVSIYEDRIDEINVSLNSYCTITKKCRNTMKISLKYNKFGEVKEIINS